ncbi:hypothetical protein [Ralstonia flaminis]|uniref:Lipoprotein n=1 Tax=Ralstonia flaminis TaxID=3058597 RepID=A0ABN9JW13_9RALS|nr:hypothetical protein [Ralstonia sp. LMG 18101]CAJ0822311.1 hypothetical protein LMG18101_04942 [Ralstonia sp. LMG 18101]
MKDLLLLATMTFSALTCELGGAGVCRWAAPGPANIVGRRLTKSDRRRHATPLPTQLPTPIERKP